MEATMKVNISIAEKGPPMWFIGVKPNIKVALTFMEPGPVEIDLDTLTQEEATHILLGVSEGKLESSVLYKDLYTYYINRFATSKEPSLQQPVTQTTSSSIVNKTAFEQKKTEDEVIIKKCQSLAKQSVRVVKSTLSRETNFRMIKLMQKIEQENQNRRSVIDFLNEKIERVNKQVISEVERAATTPTVIDPYQPYDKINFEVEEAIEQEKTVFVKSGQNQT
jgi:hypothetical protein